ncbi:MAG: phage integrase [Cypionkella sp.]|uniref:site-specific integrase n=1 Tax=Cypionkella sp. TaxID=2811411 RepID=UPI00262DB450|nr:site-specific integrase [Cypionkella sp.]MDB5659569.1 phage integrase [Cypionkella sp.]
MSNLLRRGASYSARIRVPVDLVEVIGKTELVKALGTKELSEAKRRLHPQMQMWHLEFEDLRARKSLTKDDDAAAAWSHYNQTLADDEAARVNLPTEGDVQAAKAEAVATVQAEGLDLTDRLAMLAATVGFQAKQNAADFNSAMRKAKLADTRANLIKGEMTPIADDVNEFLRANRLYAAPGSPEWVGIARAMMRGGIEGLQRTLERDAGDYAGEPRDQLVRPASGRRRASAKPGETIMDLFAIFTRENPSGVAVDRLHQMRRDIGTFVELVGASFPIASISKVEVRNWKQLLVKYPVKATETNVFAGMTISQIVKANEKIGKPVIADRTVNRYLSSLGAFLSWAVDNGYVNENVTLGLALKKETKTTTLPFNTDQLKALFASPWFAGCQSDDEWRKLAKPGNFLIRDHRYWLPLIMLFSGARPAEIGQLAVNDVRQQHGHWIMHVTTEGDETTQGKSVKTEGSMRVIPVHPELIRLGFITYHETRVREGGTALFPGAVRNLRGQMMADVSREFGRYLTRIGLKTGRGLSLYSFRHGAADALRRGGFLDQQFGFILGHTEKSMTGRYGIMPQGMLEQRVELVNAILYPGLNLDHLVLDKIK